MSASASHLAKHWSRWVSAYVASRSGSRYDEKVENPARHDPRTCRLMTVPSVGPLIATALLATVGDARQFRSGRELSAWLGLVPREHSSGQRTILLGLASVGIGICAHY